jgi:hypothetical protein
MSKESAMVKNMMFYLNRGQMGVSPMALRINDFLGDLLVEKVC